MNIDRVKSLLTELKSKIEEVEAEIGGEVTNEEGEEEREGLPEMKDPEEKPSEGFGKKPKIGAIVLAIKNKMKKGQ